LSILRFVRSIIHRVKRMTCSEYHRRRYTSLQQRNLTCNVLTHGRNILGPAGHKFGCELFVRLLLFCELLLDIRCAELKCQDNGAISRYLSLTSNICNANKSQLYQVSNTSLLGQEEIHAYLFATPRTNMQFACGLRAVSPTDSAHIHTAIIEMWMGCSSCQLRTRHYANAFCREFPCLTGLVSRLSSISFIGFIKCNVYKTYNSHVSSIFYRGITP
jgi:hypothetical protein